MLCFLHICAIALGFSFAIPPLVSEAHSKQDHATINSVFSHGFYYQYVGRNYPDGHSPFGNATSLSFGQPAKIIPDTVSFLSIMVISMIPFMAFQTLREVSEGLSYTIGVTKATIIANIINIALNYVFIKGLWGIPAMGCTGICTGYSDFQNFMVVFFILFW